MKRIHLVVLTVQIAATGGGLAWRGQRMKMMSAGSTAASLSWDLQSVRPPVAGLTAGWATGRSQQSSARPRFSSGTTHFGFHICNTWNEDVLGRFDQMECKVILSSSSWKVPSLKRWYMSVLLLLISIIISSSHDKTANCDWIKAGVLQPASALLFSPIYNHTMWDPWGVNPNPNPKGDITQAFLKFLWCPHSPHSGTEAGELKLGLCFNTEVRTLLQNPPP